MMPIAWSMTARVVNAARAQGFRATAVLMNLTRLAIVDHVRIVGSSAVLFGWNQQTVVSGDADDCATKRCRVVG
jgi:hypothetical protein